MRKKDRKNSIRNEKNYKFNGDYGLKENKKLL